MPRAGPCRAERPTGRRGARLRRRVHGASRVAPPGCGSASRRPRSKVAVHPVQRCARHRPPGRRARPRHVPACAAVPRFDSPDRAALLRRPDPALDAAVGGSVAGTAGNGVRLGTRRHAGPPRGRRRTALGAWGWSRRRVAMPRSSPGAGPASALPACGVAAGQLPSSPTRSRVRATRQAS
jgi:hypothetical protein